MAAEFSAAETVPNLLLLEVRHLGVPVLVPDPVDLLLQLLHLQQVRDKPLIPNVRVISFERDLFGTTAIRPTTTCPVI